MFKVALIVSVALLIYYILEFLTKSLLQGEDLSRYIEGLASNLEAPTLKIEIFSGAFVAWSFVCWCCSWASYQFVLKYLWKLEDSCFQVSDTFVSPKVIVVTGGSSGLGRCLVRTLLKNSKMTVIVLDKVPFHYEEADSLQDCRKDENHGDDEEMQGRLLYYPCDVSVPIQIQQVVDCLSEQIGVPDVIISNAGIESMGSFFDFSFTEVQHVFETNTFPIYSLLQALLKPSKGPGPQRSDPKRTRCHVVAIASCLGLGAVSNVSAYSASKAALLAILDSLRQEIRVLKELDPIHHSLKSSGLLVDDLYITAVCPFKIADGGMFHQIPPFPFPNLTPTVTCQHVVNVIMKELEKSCVLGTTPKTEIWVPHFVHGISYLKCLPTSIYDSVMSWMGANRSSVSVKFKRSKADLANDNSFIH